MIIRCFIYMIIVNNIVLINCGKCPPKQVLRPCICKSEVIKCEGNQSFNLKHTFHKISECLNDSEKSFNFFVLNNDAIKELEDNVFADITFRFITIRDAKSLERISSQAFNGTQNSVEVFEQTGEISLKNMTQFFIAINSLKKVISMALNIFELYSLPPYAFYNLNRLQELSLVNGQLNTISANALNFQTRSDESLIIDLTNNNLTEFSFVSHSFNEVKRPLEIDLRENRLTLLEEKIFRPFLMSDTRNSLNLRANPFNCFDCRMKWLVKDKHLFIDRVIDCRCAHFVSIFELQLNDFRNCSNFV